MVLNRTQGVKNSKSMRYGLSGIAGLGVGLFLRRYAGLSNLTSCLGFVGGAAFADQCIQALCNSKKLTLQNKEVKKIIEQSLQDEAIKQVIEKNRLKLQVESETPEVINFILEEDGIEISSPAYVEKILSSGESYFELFITVNDYLFGFIKKYEKQNPALREILKKDLTLQFTLGTKFDSEATLHEKVFFGRLELQKNQLKDSFVVGLQDEVLFLNDFGFYMELFDFANRLVKEEGWEDLSGVQGVIQEYIERKAKEIWGVEKVTVSLNRGDEGIEYQVVGVFEEGPTTKVITIEDIKKSGLRGALKLSDELKKGLGK